VQAAAIASMNGQNKLVGPVALTVVFRFPRPRSHYRTNGQLRKNAPIRQDKRPDLDKLLRAVGDALSGSVINDDSQISRVAASKIYGPPGATITLQEIAP
jgi:crossover junction endodeoxyribonuclease RusA